MARLAESSVAFALRDWQWGRGLIKKKSRGIFISLSGNADKKFGDLKIGLGDSFYLFEVKSTWDTVEEEWRRLIVKGRKHAHLMLRSVIEGVALEDQQAINILNVSLIAHHFVYADVNGPRPKLVIEPYVLGTHRKGGFFESKAREPDRSAAEKRNLLVGLEFLKRYALGLRSKEKAAPGKTILKYQKTGPLLSFLGPPLLCLISSCIFASARCCSNTLVAFNASRSARLGETRVRAAKKAFVQNSSGVMRLFPCS